MFKKIMKARSTKVKSSKLECVKKEEGISLLKGEGNFLEDSVNLSDEKDYTLNIDVSEIDVEIKNVEGKRLRVYAKGCEKFKDRDSVEFKIEENEDFVNITFSPKEDVIFSAIKGAVTITIRGLSSSSKLVIEIPKEVRFKNLRLKSSAGDVNINGFVAKNNIELTTRVGDSFIGQVHSKLLEVNASSGDVEVKDLKSEEGVFSLSVGELSIRKSSVDDLIVNTSSGDIDFTDIRAKRLMVSSSFGDVNAKSIECKNIGIKSSSGDVVLDNSLNMEYKIERLKVDVTFGDKEVTANYNK